MNEPAETLRLDGADTTMVFAWRNEIPVMVYHGARLPGDTDLETVVRISTRPLPQATLDENRPISLHPEIGRGFMGHPALIAHRPDAAGSGWAGVFNMARVEPLEDGVIFICRDEDRGLEIASTVRLCPQTDVATLSARLTNLAKEPLTVDWFAAPALSVPQSLSEQMSFHGRWTAEFEIDRRPVPLGLSKRENRRGRTSHEAFPGTILLAPTADEETGACLGVHLGWSGNHRMLLERMPTGDTQLQMGILMFSGEGAVPPGGHLDTPEIYVARSGAGLNDLSQ